MDMMVGGRAVLLALCALLCDARFGDKQDTFVKLVDARLRPSTTPVPTPALQASWIATGCTSTQGLPGYHLGTQSQAYILRDMHAWCIGAKKGDSHETRCCGSTGCGASLTCTKLTQAAEPAAKEVSKEPSTKQQVGQLKQQLSIDQKNQHAEATFKANLRETPKNEARAQEEVQSVAQLSWQQTLHRGLNCSSDQCQLYWEGDGAPDFLLYTVSVPPSKSAPAWAKSANDVDVDDEVIEHVRQYSARTGIAFLAVRHALGGVEAHWTKVVVLNRLLASGEPLLASLQHVMFIDNDVIFEPCVPSPRAAVLPYLSTGASFLITTHYSSPQQFQDNCVKSGYTKSATLVRAAATLEKSAPSEVMACSPNSGVFVAKNDAAGKRIAQIWLGAAQKSNFGRPGMWKCGTGGILNDQAGFNVHVTPKFLLNGQLRLVPSHVMNMRGGTYLKHYLGYARMEKVRLMRQHLKRARSNCEAGVTVVISAFKSPTCLKRQVRLWHSCDLVKQVRVNWFEGWPAPSMRGVVFDVLPDELSRRFAPRAFVTDAVFSVDVDTVYTCKALRLAYTVWEKHKDTMVGFHPRDLNPHGYSASYKAPWRRNVLFATKGALQHRRAFDAFYAPKYAALRREVDEHTTAEDLLMAFVHAKELSPDIRLICAEPTEWCDLACYEGGTKSLNERTSSHRKELIGKMFAVYGDPFVKQVGRAGMTWGGQEHDVCGAIPHYTISWRACAKRLKLDASIGAIVSSAGFRR